MRWTGKLPWDVIRDEMNKPKAKPPDAKALQAKVDREREHCSPLGGQAWQPKEPKP
jgi:hypothetical protein